MNSLQMKRLWLTRLVFFVLTTLVLLGNLSPSFGQATGRVNGTITDEAGEPVSGIQLEFIPTGDETGRAMTLKVSKKGSFKHSFFPRGSYTVQVDNPEWFIKSMVCDVVDGLGLAVSHQEGEAHPTQGLPPFSFRPGQQVTLTLTLASKAYKQELAQKVAVAEASGSIKKMLTLYEQGDMEGVVSLADKELAKQEDIGVLHYLRGLALFRLEQYDPAETALRRSIELDPEQDGVHVGLGSVLVKRAQGLKAAGDETAAVDLFKEAVVCIDRDLVKTPESFSILMNKAAALEGAGDHEALLDVLQVLHEADPENRQYSLRMAELHLKAERNDEAMGLLLAIPRPDRGAAELVYNMAARLFNEGEIDAAVTLGKQALELYADLAHVHRLLGRAYVGQGDIPTAILSLEKAIELADADDAATAEDKLLLEALKKQ